LSKNHHVLLASDVLADKNLTGMTSLAFSSLPLYQRNLKVKGKTLTTPSRRGEEVVEDQK